MRQMLVRFLGLRPSTHTCQTRSFLPSVEALEIRNLLSANADAIAAHAFDNLRPLSDELSRVLNSGIDNPEQIRKIERELHRLEREDVDGLRPPKHPVKPTPPSTPLTSHHHHHHHHLVAVVIPATPVVVPPVTSGTTSSSGGGSIFSYDENAPRV